MAETRTSVDEAIVLREPCFSQY